MRRMYPAYDIRKCRGVLRRRRRRIVTSYLRRVSAVATGMDKKSMAPA